LQDMTGRKHFAEARLYPAVTQYSKGF